VLDGRWPTSRAADLAGGGPITCAGTIAGQGRHPSNEPRCGHVWDPACVASTKASAEHHALFWRPVMEAAMASHPDIVNRQIQELIRKIRLHFRNEEAILHQTNATIAATHKLEHEAMEAKIGALHRGFVAGKIRRHELIDFIVIDVIAQHTRSDKIALEKAFWG
jgi:hemerythrin